jgi:hypothetical protein
MDRKIKALCDHWCNSLIGVGLYERVSKSFRTGRLERELQMVQLSATRCSCSTILWVSLVSFAAITLCIASQRVFIVYFVMTQSGNFWIHSRNFDLNGTTCMSTPKTKAVLICMGVPNVSDLETSKYVRKQRRSSDFRTIFKEMFVSAADQRTVTAVHLYHSDHIIKHFFPV